MARLTQVKSNRDGFMRSIANAECLLASFEQITSESNRQERSGSSPIDAAVLDSALIQIQRALVFFFAEHLEEQALDVSTRAMPSSKRAVLGWLEQLATESPQASYLFSELSGPGWSRFWLLSDQLFPSDSSINESVAQGVKVVDQLIASDSSPLPPILDTNDPPIAILDLALNALIELDSRMLELNQEC